MSTAPKRDGDKVTISANTFTRMDDARMRLARIERDIRNLEETIREQASGEHDGYLLQLADDLRRIMA